MKTSRMLLIIVMLTVVIHSINSTPDFSYSLDNQHRGKGWIGYCLLGTNQSPINIRNSSISPSNKNVYFENYNKPVSGIISRSLHTVYFNFDMNNNVTLSDVYQQKVYYLKNMHFHWGCTEHLLNNQSYGLELHLVHSNYMRTNIDHLVEFAVVAVLFEISKRDNIAINALLDMIKNNSTYLGEDKVSITYKDLLPSKVDFLYQYSGSLTTPPCSETVLWHIVGQKNFISQRQISEFQTLIYNLPKNCRSVQLLNQRKISKLEGNIINFGTTSSFHPKLLLRQSVLILIFSLIFLQSKYSSIH